MRPPSPSSAGPSRVGRCARSASPAPSRRDECEAVRIGDGGARVDDRSPTATATVEALPGTGYLAEVYGRGLVWACSRVQPDVCTFIEIS